MLKPAGQLSIVSLESFYYVLTHAVVGANLEFVGVQLKPDFTLDTDAMLAAVAEHEPALIYLAYPNNPTGTLFDDADIERIIAAACGERKIFANQRDSTRSARSNGSCRPS